MIELIWRSKFSLEVVDPKYQANPYQDRVKKTKIFNEVIILGENMLNNTLLTNKATKKIKLPCNVHHQNLKIIQRIFKLIYIKYFSC